MGGPGGGDVGVGGGWVWVTSKSTRNGRGKVFILNTVQVLELAQHAWCLRAYRCWAEGVALGRNTKGAIFRLDLSGARHKNMVVAAGMLSPVKRLILVSAVMVLFGLSMDRVLIRRAVVGRYIDTIPGGKPLWQLAKQNFSRVSVGPNGRPLARMQSLKFLVLHRFAVLPNLFAKKVVQNKLLPDHQKIATDAVNQLLQRMPLAPSAIVSQVRSMIGDVELMKGTNYFGINKGNVSVYIERPGATKNSGSGPAHFY